MLLLLGALWCLLQQRFAMGQHSLSGCPAWWQLDQEIGQAVQAGRQAVQSGLLPLAPLAPTHHALYGIVPPQVVTVRDGEAFITFYPGPHARVSGGPSLPA